MSEFIKNIGRCRLNGYGADLYENKNGSATIRFDKYSRELPRVHWMTFENMNRAIQFIDTLPDGNNPATLNELLVRAGIFNSVEVEGVV